MNLFWLKQIGDSPRNAINLDQVVSVETNRGRSVTLTMSNGGAREVHGDDMPLLLEALRYPKVVYG